MANLENIFQGIGYNRSTNIMELLMALVSPDTPLEEKRDIWHIWRDYYYSADQLRDFFADSLFVEDGTRYLDIVCHTNYRDFYEMAMSLDMANFDPKAYYLYWILNYGRPTETKLVKDAFEYDPDTILALFPDIQEVVFAD